MGRRDDVLTRIVEQRKKTLVYRFIGIAGSACAGLLVPGLEPGTRVVVTLALVVGYLFFAHPRIARSLDETRRLDEARAHADPTAHFTRADPLVVVVDLDVPSLAGVTLDDDVARLAPLGPVSDATEARLGALVWEDLGVLVRVDDDDRLLAFEITSGVSPLVRFERGGREVTLPRVDDDLAHETSALFGESARTDTHRGVTEHTVVRPRGLVSLGVFTPGAVTVSIHRAMADDDEHAPTSA